jgi:undecaprenyl-diphosphatase
LRVHYASDVIAGFCVGFMWLVVGLIILNRMERFSKKAINPAVEKLPLPIK